MDLTLNVTRKKENMSVLILAKKMCKIRCQIDANFKNGLIKIKNLNSNFVECFFEAIDEVFEIDEIHIVPDNYTDEVDSSAGKEVQESDDDCTAEGNSLTGEAIQKPDDDCADEVNSSTGEAIQKPDDDCADEVNSLISKATQEPDDDYTGEDNFSDGETAYEPDDDYEGEDNFSEYKIVEELEDNNKIQFEEFFYDVFADTLSAINKNETFEKRIYDFFEAIDFCQHDIVIALFIRLFLVAFKTSDVNYDTICLSLKKEYGDCYSINDIKSVTRKKFSEWLENHPIFKEKYPSATIIDLIKAFINFAC